MELFRENIQTFKPSIDLLDMNEESVLKGMGYKGIESPEYLKPLIYKYISEVNDHIKIQCGYKLFVSEKIEISKKYIVCDNVTFNVDPIIAMHLQGAEHLAIFNATIGEGLDEWLKELSRAGEQLDSFIVDIIGTCLVESAADWLAAELNRRVRTHNQKTTNRLSPGYCNWNVADQHKLFSLLPEKFCGIALNESAMMLPRKSISGIIGIGKDVKRLDYQCNICSLENCYKR